MWRHKSRSTLAQVRAWCLGAPETMLTYCQWAPVASHKNAQDIYLWRKFERCWFNITNTSTRGQWFNVKMSNKTTILQANISKLKNIDVKSHTCIGGFYVMVLILAYQFYAYMLLNNAMLVTKRKPHIFHECLSLTRSLKGTRFS